MTKTPILLAAAVLALGAVSAGAPAGAKEWKTVRIATEGAYAPWNFTDSSGKLVGFELDLAEDLCKRMGVECEVVAQAWDGIIPALQAGKYDVIMAGMSITEERDKVIDFTDAYAQTPAQLVVMKSSPLAGFSTEATFVTLPDMDDEEQAAVDAIKKAFGGKTIGVQVSTTHANFLDEYLKGDVDIREYDTQENLDLDLQAGRVDAALASLSYWVPLLTGDGGKDMVLVGPAMTGGVFGRGVGAGTREADKDLTGMISKAIQEAKADGTIKSMAEQWFGFDASAK